MKTLKINKIILLLIGLTVFTSCVEDDDFNTPDTSIVEPNIPEDAIVQISSVATELAQEQGGGSLNYSDEETTYSYIFNESDIYMVGYVVSSDEGGNFFEELIIQDKAENPTTGIKVLIDVNPLFVRYEVGRKVYIKLNGLSVGITNGVLTLGLLNGDDIEKIASASENEKILRSAETATVVPLPLSFSDFSNDKTNLFIELQDVQFNSAQTTLTYASEDFDQFDGERILESCLTGTSRIFSTSTFADFKSLTLPSGRGSMNAILSKTFEGNAFIVTINTPEDLNLDGSRCDPVFEEDFNEAIDNTDLDIDGWVNYAQAGSRVWTEQVFSGNGYAELNPFNSGDTSNIVWLISPGIDMDAQTGESLTFQTEHAFPDAGHDPLDVLISTDFDGTEAGVTTATWTSVGDFNVSYIEDFDTWYNFTDSGAIDLSDVNGTAYIAFRYTGSDTMNQNMTLHVDNVKISAQ